MKISNFNKWANKNKGFGAGNWRFDCREGWNAALDKVIDKIKWKIKICEGFPQHEDLEFLLEEIRELKEKK